MFSNAGDVVRQEVLATTCLKRLPCTAHYAISGRSCMINLEVRAQGQEDAGWRRKMGLWPRASITNYLLPHIP